MMNEWKPIETVPKDGTRILLYFPKNNQIVTCEWKDGIIDLLTSPLNWEKGQYIPTYWMELPKPPKKKHNCDNGIVKCFSVSLGSGLAIQHPGHGGSAYNVKFCPICGEKA